MRSVIVATLALTPMLLHAQANSPAQPKSSSTPNTLQSRLDSPKEIVASEADHDTAHAASIRISTGVMAPKLIHTVQIESDIDSSRSAFTYDRKTVVAMTVDASGKPNELKILKSINPVVDKNVLAAVSQYRFAPGTLDGQPTAVPVNLEIILHDSAR
jgi:TonB family protein